MRALCTEAAGVLEAVATAEDDEDEGPGAALAGAPTRFALAVKASRDAAAEAGEAPPATCGPVILTVSGACPGDPQLAVSWGRTGVQGPSRSAWQCAQAHDARMHSCSGRRHAGMPFVG